MKIIICVLLLGFTGLNANAKTDTKTALAQLKANADNSEFNRKQYQDNLDIVNDNVAQADKAIKEISQMKRQLVFNTQNVDKNKKHLNEMEHDIQRIEVKVQMKMSQEDKQIAEVQKYLTQLQANRQKRAQNLQAYDKMLQQAQNEEKEWDTQVQQMSKLEGELSSKEQGAEKEKTIWVAKRKDYSKQATLWTTKSHRALETYNKYKNLNDE